MSEHLRIERRGTTMVMEVARPKKRNALNWDMLRALTAAYTELSASKELRCGVVHAVGPHFTGGLDLMDGARAEIGQMVVAGVVRGAGLRDEGPGEAVEVGRNGLRVRGSQSGLGPRDASVDPIESTRLFLTKTLTGVATPAELWLYLAAPFLCTVVLLGVLFIYVAPRIGLEGGKGNIKLRTWKPAKAID